MNLRLQGQTHVSTQAYWAPTWVRPYPSHLKGNAAPMLVELVETLSIRKWFRQACPEPAEGLNQCYQQNRKPLVGPRKF